MAFRTQIGIAVAATAALATLYIAVFMLTGGNWIDSVRAALCNAVPTVGFGWLVTTRIAPLLWPVRSTAVLSGIVATLLLYAIISYVAALILLALTGGDKSAGGLMIRYFTGPAFVWQSFQGLAYGSIALLLGWLAITTAPQHSAPSVPTPLGRILIRTDQGIVPIEAEDIIRIAGADDYTEIILSTARHLARMTMAECETLLASEPILRVHRSHIINLKKLVHAEPTGDGRLTLMLSNGDSVTSSRAGARALRQKAG